jgi:hypothetical protein
MRNQNKLKFIEAKQKLKNKENGRAYKSKFYASIS